MAARTLAYAAPPVARRRTSRLSWLLLGVVLVGIPAVWAIPTLFPFRFVLGVPPGGDLRKEVAALGIYLGLPTMAIVTGVLTTARTFKPIFTPCSTGLAASATAIAVLELVVALVAMR